MYLSSYKIAQTLASKFAGIRSELESFATKRKQRPWLEVMLSYLSVQQDLCVFLRLLLSLLEINLLLF